MLKLKTKGKYEIYCSNRIQLANRDSKSYWSITKLIIKTSRKELKEIIIDDKTFSIQCNANKVADIFNFYFNMMAAQTIRGAYDNDLLILRVLPEYQSRPFRNHRGRIKKGQL